MLSEYLLNGEERKYFARAECTDTVFTLTLSAIGMDRDTWEALVEQVIIDFISSALAIDEDDCAGGWGSKK
jgi:hypothetical protein